MAPTLSTAPPAVAPPPAPSAAAVIPASQYSKGDGNPVDVVRQALALVCQWDVGICQEAQRTDIQFVPTGPNALGTISSSPLYTLSLNGAPISIDVSGLSAPVDETASVIAHEATHRLDMRVHPFMAWDHRRFCYYTESNAETNQLAFYRWAHPAGLPNRDSFDAWEGMPGFTDQAGVVQAAWISGYQQECGLPALLFPDNLYGAAIW